ncbi:hypothetical protein evm_014905, partial [Chilo suppressalis]
YHHRQPINVPTAGAQAFPMDGIGRLGHDPPRGPSADWWVLTTADAAGTNGLTCLSKHGGTRDRRFLFTYRPTTVKVLEEAYRVLAPGGRFLCLEFSHLPNHTLQWVYDQYSFQVIPVLGQLLAGQWRPYQYLVESIRQFPDQEKFKAMIEDAGFRQVTYENLTFGTCAIHSGFKI